MIVALQQQNACVKKKEAELVHSRKWLSVLLNSLILQIILVVFSYVSFRVLAVQSHVSARAQSHKV